MEIHIAGAGAGKTTTMSETVRHIRQDLDESLKIFCIAFTNNAVKCIKDKLQEYYGEVPSNIIISTIHSFLYNEFIKPYYYLLYDKQYNSISVSNLPSNTSYKNAKITRLEKQNILHQTVIPERAKWILCKKSGDRKQIKEKRNIIKNTFKKYCGAICIDEAQDIDKDMLEIIKSLQELGISLILMGDPKQDLKGYKCLRKLTELYPKDVKYIDICHRCPHQHIKLSNSIVPIEEKQICEKTNGLIEICFGSKKSIQDILNNQTFDLKYISKKQGIYNTHQTSNITTCQKALFEEITTALRKSCTELSELQLLSKAYSLSNNLINTYKSNGDKLLSMRLTFKDISLEPHDYGCIINAIPEETISSDTNKIIIDSIDSVKGLEGRKCLFILTTDLAAYLLGDKTDSNATKCRLYVALTRSLNYLLIYITPEVEEKYSYECIKTFFNQYSISEKI